MSYAPELSSPLLWMFIRSQDCYLVSSGDLSLVNNFFQLEDNFAKRLMTTPDISLSFINRIFQLDIQDFLNELMRGWNSKLFRHYLSKNVMLPVSGQVLKDICHISKKIHFEENISKFGEFIGLWGISNSAKTVTQSLTKFQRNSSSQQILSNALDYRLELSAVDFQKIWYCHGYKVRLMITFLEGGLMPSSHAISICIPDFRRWFSLKPTVKVKYFIE